MNQDVGLQSFKDYLFKNKRNVVTLWIVAFAAIVQFSVFKYFYPYASYIHGDSFLYIETAIKNPGISSYMIGYPMFLRMFSVFSSSDLVLTAFQYMLMQLSSLFLLFTVFYLYKPVKITQTVLLCLAVLNPLYLNMGNMVSSDSLFASLSITWFALLLWIIYFPQPRLIVWHTAIIYMAFTIRYNALIYIFIGALAFFLSSFTQRWKVIGIGSGAIAIMLFILHTGNLYKEFTGKWQYSPFAGWQWANNAMYAYRYVDSAHRKVVPARFQELDNNIRRYFDSTRDTKKFPQEAALASTFYMWSPGMPLINYRENLYKRMHQDSSASDYKKWASMGPFYKDYGIYIILQYPVHYLRYFIIPNSLKYYAPPVEFLESYNSGSDSVTVSAKSWFKYKSRSVTTRTKDHQVRLLEFYPILSGAINLVMLFGLLCYTLLGGFQSSNPFRKGIILGGTLWVFNAGFTIAASSAALRFQAFPIMLSTVFAGLLMDWIGHLAVEKTETQLHPKIEIAI